MLRNSLLLSFFFARAVLGDDWVMDTGASRLEFVADYVGADVPGRFGRFDVDLDFDPESTEAGQLVVRVDVSSLDMGDADLTTTVSERAWLDAASFATARFSSEEIVATRDGRYEAAGTLELKGLTQPVTVPFEWRRDGNAASMRGEVVLRRLDYGIGVAVEEVGNDVRVRFVVALRKD